MGFGTRVVRLIKMLCAFLVLLSAVFLFAGTFVVGWVGRGSRDGAIGWTCIAEVVLKPFYIASIWLGNVQVSVRNSSQ